MESANAIPMKHNPTIGAIRSVVYFLPILSARKAAIAAPNGAPRRGATAHHDPWSVVVGIVELFDRSFGRYGEVHPRFMPELMIEIAPVNE